MTSKGEDDGCSEEKKEKQVISLGRKRGDDTAGVAVPPPAPVNRHVPVETRGMGAAPLTLGGEDGRGQKRGLRPSVREARPGSGALGSGGRVGATSRACPPSPPPLSQTASARGTGTRRGENRPKCLGHECDAGTSARRACDRATQEPRP